MSSVRWCKLNVHRFKIVPPERLNFAEKLGAILTSCTVAMAKHYAMKRNQWCGILVL